MIKEYIIETFNNREIALIIYLIIFIIWILTFKKIRESAYLLFKSLINKWILTPILFLLIYVSMLLTGLYSIDLWDFSIFKDSVYWTFGVGFIMLMNSNEAIKEHHYFKKILLDNLKLILIVEYIVNLHVFGFLVELIIMPIVIFFSVVLAYTEVNEKYFQVKHILTIIFSFLGISYLIYAIFMIIKDFQEFVSFDILRAFLFPIIMTALFLPFAYLFTLFVLYQSLLTRLKFTIKNDKKLLRYAKWRILLTANLSLVAARKMSTGFLFNDCKTKSDIDIEIKNKISIP